MLGGRGGGFTFYDLIFIPVLSHNFVNIHIYVMFLRGDEGGYTFLVT